MHNFTFFLKLNQQLSQHQNVKFKSMLVKH